MSYTLVIMILLHTSMGFSNATASARFDNLEKDNLEKCESVKEDAVSALRDDDKFELIYAECIPGTGWSITE